MNDEFKFQENDYPGLYKASDRLSINAQKVHYRILKIYLSLMVGSAILALFVAHSTALSIVAAIVFFSVLFVSIYYTTKKYDRTWYAARAVAESVKTISWRFMMRADPFSATDDSSEVKKLFLKNLSDILQQNTHVTKRLCGVTASDDAITEKMYTVRNFELPARASFYKAQRVDEQRKWYGRKANENRLANASFFWIMVTGHAIATVTVLLKIAFPEWPYLPTEVFIVFAGCILTWSQSKRFSDLSTSYSLTAYEISIIAEQFEAFTEEIALSDYVNDTENAFSREHTQWVARKEKE